MMFSDISIEEVNCPNDYWCDSGHKAPLLFKRNGANSIAEPIKFFKVISKNKCGIFCEPCLIISRYIGNKKLLNKE